MEKYYPDVKGRINVLVSDVLAQGAALGFWNSTITIFVLKNWCRWSDKPESEQNPADELAVRVLSIAELAGEEAE
jgi:hypothetical protein